MRDGKVQHARPQRLLPVRKHRYDQARPVFARIAAVPGPRVEKVSVVDDETDFRIWQRHLLRNLPKLPRRPDDRAVHPFCR